MNRDDIAHGTPAALREFVAECLHMSAFYASMGVDFANAGDDRMLEMSLKKSVAATRQAVAVMKMLTEANERAARDRLIRIAERDGAAAALGLEGRKPT